MPPVPLVGVAKVHHIKRVLTTATQTISAFAELDVDTDASDKEDCLHLSVYVPRSAFESGSSQQLPVYLSAVLVLSRWRLFDR